MEIKQNASGPSEAFLKATIKIAHPDWTIEQINTELEKKLKENQLPSDNNCEFCSS